MWFLLLLASSALALRGLAPPPPTPTWPPIRDPVEGWLNVRLDHFKASNNDTFRMRYYYNDEFAGQQNIVIFVGGAWEIDPGWTQGGLAHEIAYTTGAALFYTEHRFYGKTRPSEYTTVEDLRYLMVDQALGDLAQFIQHVKSDSFEGGRYKDGRVALVGCSYAGSMATWMRMSYPHLVDGAFSDSGPLFAYDRFEEYLEVVGQALRTQGSQACEATVQTAVEQLLALLETPAGPQTVSEMFNTCSTIQPGAPLDMATFFWMGITETFAYLVQHATPGDIPAACAVLTDASVSDPVQRLATWVRAQPWTQPCIETRYSELVAQHTNTSYDAPQSEMRLWTYQTCMEYGWFPITSSSRQPFGNTVPIDYFRQMCLDFFSSFTSNMNIFGISRTNLFFGGWNFRPDRVVSVGGGLDPWGQYGPRWHQTREQSPVYIVPTVSHCRAIQSSATSETQELGDAKRAVIEHMRYWLTGLPSAAHAPAAGLLALVMVTARMLLA